MIAFQMRDELRI